jgi:RNA polymerase sigma-70 factor, ECF subfamily
MQSDIDRAAEQRAIDRLKGGDMAGLETLMQMHQTRAVRTAYLVLGDVPAAEDAAVDAFLAINENIQRYNPKWPFGAWLHRIVVNKAISVLRKRKREQEVDEDALERIRDQAPSPSAQAVASIARDRVWQAIQRLPENERTLVVMRYYLDFSEAEMAEAVGAPAGTVKWRLHSARNQLKLALAADYAGATLQLE